MSKKDGNSKTKSISQEGCGIVQVFQEVTELKIIKPLKTFRNFRHHS